MTDLTIRQQLLFVMTGLLLVSGALSIVLHLRASGRARDEVRETVDRIVDDLVRRGMLRVEGDEESSTATAFREGFGAGFLRGASARDGAGERLEIVRPSVRVGEGDWEIVVEGQTFDEKLLSDEGFDIDRLAGAAAIPGEERQASTRTLRRLPDPIAAATDATLPRELAIAGAVLGVGFVLTWLVAGRVTGSLRVLVARMEAVARGDLEDDPGDALAAALPGRRDEARRVRVAFSAMLESLREKRELERKAARAEQLAAVGTLAAGIAHDIRNPLNTIGLSLEHLQECWTPRDADRRAELDPLLGDVRGELDRIRRLIDEFLSLARTDEGATREPRRVLEVLEEAVRLFRTEAASRGVRLVVRLDEVGSLALDVGGFRRATANLVLNALQACEPAASSEASVVVELRRETASDGSGDAIVLSVRDNGGGMSPEAVDKAALPYWTTRSDGVGLGLPIARGFAESHGGTLELRSVPDEGTEAILRLPAEPRREEARAA